MKEYSIKLQAIIDKTAILNSAALLSIFDEQGKEYFGRCMIVGNEINIIFQNY